MSEPASHTPRGEDDLMELVRYQRSKAQIAETELEQARLEVARLQQQVGHYVHQLDETRRLLADERERSQTSLRTAQEHADLQEKVRKNIHICTQ